MADDTLSVTTPPPPPADPWGPSAPPLPLAAKPVVVKPSPGEIPYNGPRDTRSEFEKGVDDERVRVRQDLADEDQAAAILKWQAENNDLAPGTSAEIAKYAAALHLEPSVVRDNLPEIQKRAAYQLPWKQLVEDHPVLSKLIGDPDLGPAVIQDSAALMGLEALVGRWETRPPTKTEIEAAGGEEGAAKPVIELKYPGVVQTELSRGWKSLKLDVASFSRLTGLGHLNMLLDPSEVSKTVDELATGIPLSDAAAHAWQRNSNIQSDVVTKLNSELAGAVNITGDLRGYGTAGRFFLNNAADALGFVPMAATQAAVTIGTAGLGGGIAAVRGANWLFNFTLFAGGNYNRLAHYKDPETGQEFSETVKTIASLAGGAAAAQVFSPIATKISAEQLNLLGLRILPEAYGASVREALASPSLLGAFGTWGKQAGLHTLEGASGMAAAAGIEAATEELAKSYAFGTPASPEVVARSAFKGFTDAARTLPFLVAWGPSRAVIDHLGKARRAERSSELINTLLTGRENSKLAKEAPEVYEEFLRRSANAEEGNPKTALVNKDIWDAEMSAQGLDPRDVHAELVGDKGASYDEATRGHSGDLEIPIEKVGRLAKSQALSDFAVRELRAYKSDESLGDVMRTTTKVAERMKEILAQSKGDDENAVRKKIEDTIGPVLDELVNKYPEAEREFRFGRITAESRPVVQKALADIMFADVLQTAARVPEGRYAKLQDFYQDYYANVVVPTLTEMKQATDPGIRDAVGGRDISGEREGKALYGQVQSMERRHSQHTLALFKNANPGTPFHEWMHLQTWLKQHLLDKLQKEGVSAPLLAQHYRDMLNLMESPEGVREFSLKSSAAEDLLRQPGMVARWHASEEKLAHLFEEYLLRAKIPPDALVAESLPALQALLRETMGGIAPPEGWAKFRLTERHFLDQLKSTELTPEAIAWFDSLISAEASVESAARSLSVMPLDRVLEGLPEAQRKAYFDMSEETKASARAAVVALIRQAQRAGTQDWIKDTRARVAAQLSETLKVDQGYKSIDFLMRGEGLPFPAFKLDPAEFKAESQQMFDFVQKNNPEVFAKAGEAAHPLDIAALLLGYDGKAELVWDLAMLGGRERPKLADAVEQGTEAQMQDLFGAAYKPSPADLAREALDVMSHSKSLFEKSLIELRWIAEQSGNADLRQRAALLGNDTARQIARDLMAQRSWFNFKPEEFLRAERKYAEKAFVALEGGDMSQAYALKEAQLFNQIFFSEARQAEIKLKANMTRLRANAKDEAFRQSLGLAGNGVGDGMGFVNVFDAITNALQITSRQLPSDIMVGFLDTVQRKLPPGMLIFDPAGLADALSRLQTANPTVGDVSMLALVVKNIVGLAETVNSETMKTRNERYDTARGKMITDLNRLPPKPPDVFREGQEGLARKIKRGIEAFDAALLDPEFLIEMVGPTAHEVIFKPFLDARTKENALRKAVQPWITEAFTKQSKELSALRDTEINLDGDLPIDPSVVTTRAGPRDHGWLWMVALNFGNAEGRQRLLDGYGWTGEQVRAALDKHLTSKEWDFLESVWKHLDESLWPAIAEKQKRMVGLAPEKVEAVPLTLANGREIRGGYFPLRYDPKSQRGLVRAVEQATEGGDIDMPMVTPHGFVYKRVDRYIDLPWLSWSIVPSHINQVIHDVAFGEYMFDMRRLLADAQLQTILKSRLGEVRNDNIMGWLKNVAMNGSEAVAQHQQVLVNHVLGTPRQWFVNGVLGLSFPVIAADFLNPLVAAIGQRITFRDLATTYAVTPGAIAFVKEKSQYMSDRRDNFLRDFQTLLQQPEHGNRRRQFNDLLYSLMDGLDKMTSTAIWMAKYKEIVRTEKAGEMTPELEAKAVEAANYAVRRSLPSQSLLERSSILRDRRTLGMLLIFYSWFNRTYNMARQVTHDPWIDFVNEPGAKTGATLAGATGRALALLFFSGAVGDYVSGRGREKDETWGQYWGRKAIAAPFTALPFVSGYADILAGRIVTGRTKTAPVRSAPILSAIQSLTQELGNVANERHFPEDRLVDLASLGVLVGGGPAAQFRRTVGYGTRWTLGHERPRSALEATGGLLYGTRPYSSNQPSNPFSDLGEEIK